MEELLREIRDELRRANAINAKLWTAEDCAAYLRKKDAEYVCELFRNQAKTGFPSPRQNTSVIRGIEREGQKLWDAKEVMAWWARQPKVSPTLQPKKKQKRCNTASTSEGLYVPPSSQAPAYAACQQEG